MNKGLILWLLLFLAFIIRIMSVYVPFYGDENPWPYEAQDHSKYGFNFEIQRAHDVFIWTSPPLAPLVYRFFTWFIGVDEFTMRLVPLIIGLINIFLTYILARKLFDERTALFSAFIMVISFWHVVASFLVEHDGSILTLFWLLFFITYVNFERTANSKYLLLCGIILGLALLTKLTGGLILVALFIYLLFKQGFSKIAIIVCSKIFFISVLVFSIFPILSLIMYPEYFLTTLSHSSRMSLIPSFFGMLRIMIYLFLWATPLLSGLALISLFSKNEKYKLFWSWCLVVILFAVFSRYVGAVDRYMSVMIPALCILCGSVLRNFNFKDFKFILISTICAFFLFFVLNLVPSAWVEHDVVDYIYRAVKFQWNFIFQFHGGGGPGFMVSFIPLGVGIILSSIFGLLTIFSSFSKKLFILFFSISLAFNLFLVQAFIFNYPYPDIGASTLSMIDYVSENDFSKPFYVTNMNFGWYMNLTSDFYVVGDVYSDEKQEVDMIKSMIKEKRGTLIIQDYPKRLKTDNVWILSEECRLNKSFEHNNIILGYVFVC